MNTNIIQLNEIRGFSNFKFFQILDFKFSFSIPFTEHVCFSHQDGTLKTDLLQFNINFF